MDSRIKSGKVIRAGDENTLTPRFQAVEHGRPELGALIFAYPHAQYILSAIQINAYGNIHRFLYDLPPPADMVVDGIQKYPRRRWTPEAAAATLWPQAGILSVIRLTVLSETRNTVDILN